MALNAGDIAIVAYNADGTDDFSFVALVDIPAGEVIKFTDNGVTSAGAFRSGEGIITWTAPAGGVRSGVVVTIATTPSATVGTVTESGDLNFSGTGDQIVAYQGDDAAPTFLFALNNEGAGEFQADATSSNTSALPTGLTDGEDAVALSEVDNAVYTGPTSGTKAALLAAITDNTNWTGDDAVNQTAPASFAVGIIGTSDPETLDGTLDADTIIGGAGADTLNGNDGDDTFLFADGDLAAGEEVNGGNGTDTLVFQGGTHDLTGATLTSIEAIELDDAAGTQITVATLDQAALIMAATGGNDVLNILDATPAPGVVQAEVLFDLIENGVETINYTGAAGTFTATRGGGTSIDIIDPRGQSHNVGFEDGKRTSSLTSDIGGTYDWESVLRTYDATGAQTSDQRVMNDGTTITTVFENGQRVSVTNSDTAGLSSAYQDITKNYDAVGTLTSETRVLDNGVSIATFYDNGQRVSVTTSDAGTPGQYAFQTQTRSYDMLGNQTSREMLLDDGNRVVNGGDGAQSIEASTSVAIDILTGGAGADVFVFATGFGDARIGDFTAGDDLLDLTSFGIGSLAELQAAATLTQIGTKARIEIGDDMLTLVNFDLANLEDSMFA